MPQQQFKGYSQDQMKRIASKLGHTGDLNTFNNYLGTNPQAMGKYKALKDAAVKRYARGGMVKSGYAVGGLSAMSNQDIIQRIFKDPETGLGRSVGAAGLEYYSGKLDSATTPEAKDAMIQEIQQNILDSAEFENRAATGGQQRYVSEANQITGTGIDYNQGDNTANNAAIIQSRYQSDLGRAAGQTGQDYYTGRMDGTVEGSGNPDDIRADIRGSTEAIDYGLTGQQQYVGADNQIDGVKYNPVGTGNVGTPPPTPPADGTPPPVDGGITFDKDLTTKQLTVNQSLLPQLATGTKTVGEPTTTNTNQLLDTTKGQVDNTTFDPATGVGLPTSAAGTSTAGSADDITTKSVVEQGSNTDADPAIKNVLALTKAQTGNIDDDNKVVGQEQYTTNVDDLSAAQTNATTVQAAPTRLYDKPNEEVQAVANAQTAAAFTEQIQAASADPSLKATVQGQLATLMTSFDNGNTPAWAAGAMRGVTATMAARGIGSSSMAGQALIQSALESALPIATADAQTYATFEMTNLNNKQQRVMLSAQQRATFMGLEFDQGFQERVFNSTRIGDIANMNFNAGQQIAIENAQVANSVNLANLNNSQANVMAEAAALSQLEMASLSNLQQQQVQNAKTFLDMDMANLSNKQQTALFKAQSRSQSILSDAAADNAREQFNASSENQTNQFFKTLSSQVSQFNAAQDTAVSQSNAGDKTAVSKFNAEVKNQRQQFNATNGLIINQANATWRREIATSDTATINRVNEINAKAALDISNQAYTNLWQEYRDEIDWGYQVQEGEAERYNALARSTIAAEAEIAKGEGNTETTMWENIASIGLSYLKYKDGKKST